MRVILARWQRILRRSDPAAAPVVCPRVSGQANGHDASQLVEWRLADVRRDHSEDDTILEETESWIGMLRVFECCAHTLIENPPARKPGILISSVISTLR